MMRIVKAFGHSIDGVREAIANHTAFRQELIITTVLVPLAIWLGQNGVERSILIGTLLIILIVELVNSAIENTVDRIGNDKNILSKNAKDLGSAAVFIAIVNAVLIWILVLFQ
ncbi:MAG: diacylglycerol kinase [Anaerolineales bacterium]|jgi:diacylglycerol kinase (ATP)|nr:diacylglycerol kinase [Anaerolineales bacterium]